MSILPLLLSCVTMVLAGPPVNKTTQHMEGVAGAMLKNLVEYAVQRGQAGEINALTKIFDLYYTDSEGITHTASVRRCYSQQGLTTIRNCLVWDPKCVLQVDHFGIPGRMMKDHDIQALIRIIDAIKFENNGTYTADSQADGVTMLTGHWLASQKGTQKTMPCDVYFKFKDVGSNQVGLFGMAMDCDSCEFNPNSSRFNMFRQMFKVEFNC